MDFLSGTPYSVSSDFEEEMAEHLSVLDKRVTLLRTNLVLTEETLRHYYGDRRFELVAESNALEGSTLSVGETEVAVLKGVTLTGHDPAYSRDAIALDSALRRVAELAKEKGPTTIDEALEVHGLILGDRPEAGRLRNVPVRLGGSEHRPPKTLKEVSESMKCWENWSAANEKIHPVLRAIVLHTWLTHIHPFEDGNGRTARAVTTLELIRAGYPPIIIKKAEKTRYLAGLRESDSGGELTSLIEFFIEKSEGALIGLELAAKQQQAYNPVALRIREQQTSIAKIWGTSVHLLADQIEHFLAVAVAEVGGRVFVRKMFDTFDVDTWVSVANRDASGAGWAFTISLEAPGVQKIEVLAFFGHRSASMFHHFGDEAGCSLFWSKRNPAGSPRWQKWLAPFGCELSMPLTGGGEWHVRYPDGTIRTLSGRDFSEQFASGVFA